VETVLARGPNFVYGKEFVRQEHGLRTWEEVVDAMPAEDRSVWTGHLLITDAYPFAAFKSMLKALTEVVGARPEEETAQMYSYIADRSLNSVYKFFFRFAQPSFVISRYPVLWQRFFKSGTVEVPVAEAGRARLDFTLPEIFLDWLRPACLGYSTKAISLSGGSDLEMTELEQSPLADGDWRISYELAWKE
jgi:hypothetical protein